MGGACVARTAAAGGCAGGGGRVKGCFPFLGDPHTQPDQGALTMPTPTVTVAPVPVASGAKKSPVRVRRMSGSVLVATAVAASVKHSAAHISSLTVACASKPGPVGTRNTPRRLRDFPAPAWRGTLTVMVRKRCTASDDARRSVGIHCCTCVAFTRLNNAEGILGRWARNPGTLPPPPPPPPPPPLHPTQACTLMR